MFKHSRSTCSFGQSINGYKGAQLNFDYSCVDLTRLSKNDGTASRELDEVCDAYLRVCELTFITIPAGTGDGHSMGASYSDLSGHGNARWA
jgi:hypothetical protein